MIRAIDILTDRIPTATFDEPVLAGEAAAHAGAPHFDWCHDRCTGCGVAILRSAGAPDGLVYLCVGCAVASPGERLS